MARLDWSGLTKPSAPSPLAGELSNISSLLQAYADRRLQMQQLEQQRMAAEAQRAEMHRHHLATEQYNRDNLGWQREHAEAQNAARIQAAQVKANQRLQEQAAKAAPDVRKALGEQDVEGARLIAQANGMEFEPEMPPSPFLSSLPPLTPPASIAEEAAPDLQQRQAQYAAQAEADHQAVANPQPTGNYTLRMPAGAETTLSLAADNQARLARGKQLADSLAPQFEEMITRLPPEHQKLGRVAADESLGQAQTGAFKTPQDAFETYSKRIGALIEQQESTRRAGMHGVKVTPGEEARFTQSAARDLRTDVQQWQKDAGYDDAREEHRALQIALREIRSKNQIDSTSARFAIGRKIAGPGVFTEDEQRKIIESVGGKWESFNQLVEAWMSGGLAAGQRKIFEQSIMGRFGDLVTRRVDELERDFRESFIDDPLYQNMKGNTAHWYNRNFRTFGRPPIKVDGATIIIDSPAGKRATGIRPPSETRPERGNPTPAPDPNKQAAERERLKQLLRRNPALRQKLSGEAP